MENHLIPSQAKRSALRLFAILLLLVVALCPSAARAQQTEPSLPVSQRFTINLAAGVPQYLGDAATTSNLPQSNWWYENTNDSAMYATPGFVESTDSAATWRQVGLPYDANVPRTFINQDSGGGQGSLDGQNNWYRLHIKVDPKYASQRFMVENEGSHTGVQAYINGTLLPGVSAVTADAKASHVVGFIPVLVDLTPYIKADGATDNVLAVDVSRGASWFEQPGFSGAFRFGQAMAGLFRNVYMFVTNTIYIPVNVYSNQKTWGTYVSTVSEVPAAEGTATAASAVVAVQTNILNQSPVSQQVTLTTQIVDGKGNVVVTAAPITQTLAPLSASNPAPSGPAGMFQQQITVPNPTLWYPNNSIYGTPYMYKVYSIVSVNGAVVDAVQSPLGIRTITWDTNYPYFNGHAMNLWGGSGRYDYPALGSSVPDEQKWRDLEIFAAAGGNIWRPGHSSESEEFVEAADEYGVMVDQPSGDGEGYFSDPTADDVTLKYELHRDMIVRDRNHPSILDWESNNGTMEESVGKALIQVDQTWDPINTRVAADRTPDPVNGYMLGCTLEGCEVGVKNEFPNNPAWGSEYWGTGSARGMAYDYELQFVAPFIDNWRKGVAAKAFGMAQWYFADTPGESQTAFWESNGDAKGPGNVNDIRSIGTSMVDQNRLPKLLYYVYQADWTPYSVKPVVHLAHHWNRAYEYTRGTPIQENAFSNCPSVQLLINGLPNDPVTGQLLPSQTPNPPDSATTNFGQSTTTLPGQVHWMVNWAAGTVTAECLDINGNVVPGVTDTRTTAGAENKIVLSAVPELTKPDGTSFQWTANGSDAAFVVAEVEDANGNLVPTAADNVTFSVSGPAAYMGGTQQYVYDTGDDWTTYYVDAFSAPQASVIGGVPYAFFHSPGDPELNFEGGLQKIALRSTFTPGTVTVTATAPGLAPGTAQLTSVLPPPPPQSQPPSIIVPPVNTSTTAGYPATFTVSATGGGTLTYQWYENGGAIAGATGTTYNTPATTLAESGESFTVTVTNSFGTVSSNAATLTVEPAANVAITTQPVSQAAVIGQSATLTVVATGSPALTYQWYQVGFGVISGATQPSYSTPVLTATGTESFYVVVANPIGSATSNTVTLTINAPTPVTIVTQPRSQAVAENLPATVSVTVGGSTPYTYQWQFTPANGTAAPAVNGNGTTNSSTISYNIEAFSSANVGAYTVTVNNAAGAPATSAAAQLTLAPPGANLALDKTATSSSTQNACTDGTTTPPYTGTGCLGPENAVDGNLSTRWGSAVANAPPTTPVAGVDPSWLEVDLGSFQAFNTVIIYWENAYATQYEIQYSTDNATWKTAFTNNAGVGGTDTENFPTVQGRYIRMLGQQRSTQYGYSIYEFQVYDVAQCGSPGERYTINASTPTLVTDNLTGLTWTRTIQTDTGPGSQFTGLDAATYCSSLKMRLPTELEALGISGTSDAICAFPGAWSTWTSTVDPQNANDTAFVSYDGTMSYQVTDNYPGETLCDSGAASSPTAATPTFSPAGGTYAGAQSVVIADATSGATIYYTTNGTTPTTTSAVYSGPIAVSATETLEAIAAASGYANSAVATAAYTINAGLTPAATPVFTPAGGAYTSAQSVAISDATSGATLYYTTNGATPTTASAVYSGPVTVSATETLEAIAVASGHSNSAVATAAYTITAASGGSDVLDINASGPTVGSYLADEDFAGGTESNTTNTISTAGVTNPAPEAVYQSQRFGNFTYTLPGLTAGAAYTVRLHFAEFYWDAAGSRVANVLINGAQVLTNFDIFAAAGGQNLAVVEQFNTSANTSGQIVIQFVTVKDNAAVNGIEIETSGGSLPAAAIPTFSPAAGSYAGTQMVKVSDATAGATIYYTTNGATPTTASTLYSGSITVSASETLKAIAIAGGYSNSAVATAAYTITQGTGTDVLDIDAGGAAAGSYLADEDYVGGNTSYMSAAISTSLVANPAPQAVYQTERFGDFTYTIPSLTAGTTYTVNLHFAEIYWAAAGKREFNVLINGAQVLTNFDVFATAGGEDIAIVKSFPATASATGTITIQFTTGAADLPKVSGIEVVH